VRQPALTPGQKKALDGNYEPGDLTKDDMNNLQYNELATIFKQAFDEDQDRLYKYLHQQARYEVAASLFPHWDNAEDKLIGFFLPFANGTWRSNSFNTIPRSFKRANKTKDS